MKLISCTLCSKGPCEKGEIVKCTLLCPSAQALERRPDPMDRPFRADYIPQFMQQDSIRAHGLGVKL